MQFYNLADKMLNPLNILEQAKEKIETALNHHNHHDKETHGLRNDINENTPLIDVKAPNVFERAKEEIEALVETIHQKMETKTNGERYGKTSVCFWIKIEQPKIRFSASVLLLKELLYLPCSGIRQQNQRTRIHCQV